MAIIGYELGNSTNSIDPEIWSGDGVLQKILARVAMHLGVSGSESNPATFLDIVDAMPNVKKGDQNA